MCIRDSLRSVLRFWGELATRGRGERRRWGIKEMERLRAERAAAEEALAKLEAKRRNLESAAGRARHTEDRMQELLSMKQTVGAAEARARIQQQQNKERQEHMDRQSLIFSNQQRQHKLAVLIWQARVHSRMSLQTVRAILCWHFNSRLDTRSERSLSQHRDRSLTAAHEPHPSGRERALQHFMAKHSEVANSGATREASVLDSEAAAVSLNQFLGTQRQPTLQQESGPPQAHEFQRYLANRQGLSGVFVSRLQELEEQITSIK
eukprot:TRINITY_DN7292_c0_g1_i2.p1 TRINITY_DN7292_c0_g1~~TRINITY_DN7292_c0_g1_i2.p1  ORF type:complete len:264 (+),score=67.67 TRINITY_DN7292_c0_g1_i2:138-929(+)